MERDRGASPTGGAGAADGTEAPEPVRHPRRRRQRRRQPDKPDVRALRRHLSASGHAAAPAGGALLRRRAARAPGQSPPRDSRGLRRRVGDVRRRRGGGDPRPDRRQEAARTSEARLGDETAAVREALRAFAELGDGVDPCAGDRRGARRRDRGPTRMGGPRRPGSPGRPRSRTRPRRPWPSPCWKPSTSCAGTARRGRPTPAAELEVEPAAAHPGRSPPLGDGGAAPPARRLPRRRRLAGAGRAATAISGGRCCRFPPSRRPTATCRYRLVRATASPRTDSPWPTVCRLAAKARDGAVLDASIEDRILRVDRTEAAVPARPSSPGARPSSRSRP